MPNVIEQTKFITSDGIKTSIGANNLTFGNFNNYNEFVNSTGFQEGILLDLSDCFPLPSDLRTKIITLKNNYFIRVEYGYRTGWGNWLCAYFYRSDATLLNRLSFENAGGFNYNLYKCWFYTDGSGKYGRCEIKRNANSNTVTVSNLTSPDNEVTAQYNELINGALAPDDPFGLADPITEGEGGYGDFDYSSDDDDFPDLPAVSVTAAGFVNLFKLDSTGVASLADYLWSGLFDIASFLKLFSDPMDCILSLGIVPLDPVASAPLYIIVGNHATTVQAPRVTNQFQELDCGSITIDGSKYSNSFMDYSPYSKAELYLPYVGTVALDIDEIMDSTITVKYHIDLLSGSCVAYVKVSKNYYYKGAQHTHSNIMYQFSGNVLTNVPINSQNYTQILQAVIGAVAVGVSGTAKLATTGEVSGMFTEEQAGSLIGATQQMKSPVTRSGNCSSACGLLGTQKPKLILTLPKIAYAEDMNLERGYPTYMRKTLSSMVGTGFTKVELAHIKGIPCTDSERAEILRLLEGGVEM